MLSIKLGNKSDLIWAQEIVSLYHYLHSPVDNRARPMVYVISWFQKPVGLVMVGSPHATKCRGWWGYPGLITQWQVVDLNRIWLDPALQFGGKLAKPGVVPGFTDRKGVFRPTVLSWVIEQILTRVQKDRVSMWPPVYLNQPYHIRLVISYHDPQYHKGSIYRVTGAEPMYHNHGVPIPGPSGKYGWCYPLPEPSWTWEDIPIRQPRTIRMALELS